MDQSLLGARGRKLLQVFSRAVNGTIEKSSLQRFKQVFQFLGPNVDIIDIAHQRAMQHFREKLEKDFQKLLDEYKVMEKLNNLDNAIAEGHGIDCISEPQQYIAMEAVSVMGQENITEQVKQVMSKISNHMSELESTVTRITELTDKWDETLRKTKTNEEMM